MPVFAMPTHAAVGNFRNVSEQSYKKDASIRNTAFQKLKNLCFSALCNWTLDCGLEVPWVEVGFQQQRALLAQQMMELSALVAETDW